MLKKHITTSKQNHNKESTISKLKGNSYIGVGVFFNKS